MWDLGPWPGIEPGSPALGVQSLTHGTSREVSLFKVLPFFLSSLEFMVHHFSYSFTEAQTTCLLTLCSCWPAGLHLEWPHPLAFPGLSLSSWTRVAGGESESQIAWYHCKSRFLGSQHCLGLFIHFSSPLFSLLCREFQISVSWLSDFCPPSFRRKLHFWFTGRRKKTYSCEIILISVSDL